MKNTKALEKEAELQLKNLAKKQIKIPTKIFETDKLTAFEALVLFLKDSGYTYHKVAETLKRDDRTIWNTYKRAKSKSS